MNVHTCRHTLHTTNLMRCIILSPNHASLTLTAMCMKRIHHMHHMYHTHVGSNQCWWVPGDGSLMNHSAKHKLTVPSIAGSSSTRGAHQGMHGRTWENDTRQYWLCACMQQRLACMCTSVPTSTQRSSTSLSVNCQAAGTHMRLQPSTWGDSCMRRSWLTTHAAASHARSYETNMKCLATPPTHTHARTHTHTRVAEHARERAIHNVTRAWLAHHVLLLRT
mmetsp:Transcript_24259/g.53030  ORF Transcript_24259/g.53030 Transcript_24259/m.53030 type:complete len:221 (-) Transcript_24259:153-815(-)